MKLKMCYAKYKYCFQWKKKFKDLSRIFCLIFLILIEILIPIFGKLRTLKYIGYYMYNIKHVIVIVYNSLHGTIAYTV